MTSKTEYNPKCLIWLQLFNQAFEKKVESEKFLDKAVQTLMSEKGFSKEAVSHFNACFAGGNETVISFNQEGEMADLDLTIASTMTKDEIIQCLSRFLSKKSIITMLSD